MVFTGYGPGSRANIPVAPGAAQTPVTTPYSRQTNPLVICRGTVITAYQSLGVYDVATDYGRFSATSHGATRSPLGAREGGSYTAGQQVWVAVDPAMPAWNAFVIGGSDLPIAPIGGQASSYLTYPQAAGVQFESPDGGATYNGVRLSDYLYTVLNGLRHYGGPAQDGVDGDWLMLNTFGGGVSVEPFRASLTGGSFSGLTVDSDNNARLFGEAIEIKTLSREYEDRRSSNVLIELDRRVFWPIDALLDERPQIISADSPLYSGLSKFHTYRIKDNLPTTAQAGQINAVGSAGQIALLHEHRGIDGAYRLTSASSIMLEKHFGIVVPQENVQRAIRNDIPPNFPGVLPRDTLTGGVAYPTPTTHIGSTPADDPQVIAARAQSPVTTSTDIRVDIGQAPTATISMALNAQGLLKDLFDWQCAGGFQELSAQWSEKTYPGYFVNFRDWQTGNPTAVRNTNQRQLIENYTSVSPSCWKKPRSILLNVSPYTAQKRIYLGRSIIALLDDGGIVIKEAGGAQIALSGGAIHISAPSDTTIYCGRNRLDVTGNDYAHRVDRHSDHTAGGTASFSANLKCMIAGGLSGHGQLLVYGGGQNMAIAEGEGLPADGGGVVISSPHSATINSRDVVLRAKRSGWTAADDGTYVKSGGVYMDSEQPIAIRTANQDAPADNYSYLWLGAEIVGSGSSQAGTFVIGKTSFLGDLVANSVQYNKIGYQLQASTMAAFRTQKASAMKVALNATLKSTLDGGLISVVPTPMTPSAYGVNSTVAALYFTIYFPRWLIDQSTFYRALGALGAAPNTTSAQHPLGNISFAGEAKVAVRDDRDSAPGPTLYLYPNAYQVQSLPKS